MSYNYRADIREINDYVQEDPLHMRRMLLFVLATIQQQLETVPVILDDFVNGNEAASQFAFGSKRDGIRWLQDTDNLDWLYGEALAQKDNAVSLVQAFLEVPGLGLVKAGFAAQLWNNKVGCLDTHNLKLYDVPLGAVRYNKRAGIETRLRRIGDYVALTRAVGGSTKLWSSWCHYVHTQRPSNWHNGGDVSYFHVANIIGGYDVRESAFFLDLDYQPKFIERGYEPDLT